MSTHFRCYQIRIESWFSLEIYVLYFRTLPLWFLLHGTFFLQGQYGSFNLFWFLQMLLPHRGFPDHPIWNRVLLLFTLILKYSVLIKIVRLRYSRANRSGDNCQWKDSLLLTVPKRRGHVILWKTVPEGHKSQMSKHLDIEKSKND